MPLYNYFLLINLANDIFTFLVGSILIRKQTITRNMIIIHVCCLGSSSSNGIKSVLTNLIPEQKALGNTLIVFNLVNNEQKIFENEIFIAGYKEFRNEINNLPPSVVVFHGGYELKFYLYAWLLKKNNIPYIIVPHGGTSKHNLHKKRILKTIVNVLFTHRFITNAAGVSFLNESEWKDSIFNKDIRHYAIIPNGISKIAQKPFVNHSESTVHFIYLARIDFDNKRPDVLLRAVEKLHAKHPEIDFDFHFYGGRYDPSIVQKFKDIVKATKGPVFYHGEVFGKDKEIAFSESDIYVLTSLYEGMPLTVLEALSYGTPCIVTPQTNMADLIKDNHAGWVTESDEDSISEILYKAYVEYKENRDEFIDNALNAVRPYRWDAIAKKSIEEYARLTEKTEIL